MSVLHRRHRYNKYYNYILCTKRHNIVMYHKLIYSTSTTMNIINYGSISNKAYRVPTYYIGLLKKLKAT